MNILYFSPVPFEPVRHGNISTINQYVRRLMHKGHSVYFVYLDQSCCSISDIAAMSSLVTKLEVLPCNRKVTPQKNVQGYDIFDSYYQDKLGEYIANFCKMYNIEAIICTYIWYSKLLEYVPKNVLKIIDTHDKMTDRHLALKENHIIDEMFSCTEEDEAKYLNRADIIWARRDEETEYFNKITNSNKAVTVTHFEPEKFLHKKYAKLKTIGILASNNQVNYKMVCNFVGKLNKRMKKEPIDIELMITGQVKIMILPPKKPLRRLSNFYYKVLGRKDKIKGEDAHLFYKDYINLTGPIDDIADFYNNVDLVLIPITFGTGINVKMVEAMAYGVPVISTECGIKGMDSTSEYHHCKDIDSLIDKIYEICKNPALLRELAQKSEECYTKFLDKAMENFDKTFERNVYAAK